MYYESDSLMHYGVPGMKWGVRKSRPKSTGKRKKAVALFGKKKKVKKPAQKVTASKSKPKSVKDMTDEELKAAVARLQMENNYITFTKNVNQYCTAQRKTAGQKFAEGLKDVTVTALKESSKELLKKNVVKVGDSLISKMTATP